DLIPLWPAVEQIVSVATGEHVVPTVAGKIVIPCAAGQRVGPFATERPDLLLDAASHRQIVGSSTEPNSKTAQANGRMRFGTSIVGDRHIALIGGQLDAVREVAAIKGNL